MKKVLIIAVVIITAIIAGVLLINIYEADTEVTKDTTKVGMIMNSTADDRNWGQSHKEAIATTAQELNLETLFRENVTADTFAETVDELVDKGCEIIIANSLTFDKLIVEAAEKYPDIYFLHAAGGETRRNLSTYFGRIYQIRYLCGIVAGLQTKTNEIGYVAAMPVSEVNRGINAFALGVREVNPDANVYVSWTHSWADDNDAAEATEALFNAHDIDVMTVHSDSNMPLQMAEERGVYSIGYNVDNSEHYPETYLAAAVWDWENFYTPCILKCLQGKFEGENYWLGIDTGTVSLSQFTDNVDEGIYDIVNSHADKLRSGTFDVFYGPIRDNEGNIRVAEGENRSYGKNRMG